MIKTKYLEVNKADMKYYISIKDHNILLLEKNTKIKKLKEELDKLYKETLLMCPKCHQIVTIQDTFDDCSAGGCGMCDCEFMPGRIYHKYIPLTKEFVKELMKRKK